MKKVTGIGGIFFRCKDPAAQLEWYTKNLGIDPTPWGGSVFMWRDDAGKEAPGGRGYTVWSPFQQDSEKFAPSDSTLMINYRVADMDALVAAMRAAGVEFVGEVEQHPNGKFAWVLDPEGNKIELWEPVPSDQDPYI